MNRSAIIVGAVSALGAGCQLIAGIRDVGPYPDAGTTTSSTTTLGMTTSSTTSTTTTGVQCVASAQCSGATPACNTTTNTCVQCVASAQCSGATPVCNTTTNTCVACNADADCGMSGPCNVCPGGRTALPRAARARSRPSQQAPARAPSPRATRAATPTCGPLGTFAVGAGPQRDRVRRHEHVGHQRGRQQQRHRAVADRRDARHLRRGHRPGAGSRSTARTCGSPTTAATASPSCRRPARRSAPSPWAASRGRSRSTARTCGSPTVGSNNVTELSPTRRDARHLRRGHGPQGDRVRRHEHVGHQLATATRHQAVAERRDARHLRRGQRPGGDRVRRHEHVGHQLRRQHRHRAVADAARRSAPSPWAPARRRSRSTARTCGSPTSSSNTVTELSPTGATLGTFAVGADADRDRVRRRAHVGHATGAPATTSPSCRGRTARASPGRRTTAARPLRRSPRRSGPRDCPPRRPRARPPRRDGGQEGVQVTAGRDVAAAPVAPRPCALPSGDDHPWQQHRARDGRARRPRPRAVRLRGRGEGQRGHRRARQRHHREHQQRIVVRIVRQRLVL